MGKRLAMSDIPNLKKGQMLILKQQMKVSNSPPVNTIFTVRGVELLSGSSSKYLSILTYTDANGVQGIVQMRHSADCFELYSDNEGEAFLNALF